MERLSAIAGSVVLHLLIVGVLFFTVWEETPPPKVTAQKPVIQARAVDEATAMAAVRKREAEEKRKADEKRKAVEAEKKRKAEEKRKKVEAEKKRQATLKRKKDEEEKQRKKEETEKKRLAEEKRKKEEAERKRKEEEDRKQREEEFKRKMAEEAERMAEEERAQRSAQLGREEQKYIAAIQSAIKSNWRIPRGNEGLIRCKVSVNQTPTGYVIGVHVIESCGTPMLDSSLVSAVRRSEPLPTTENWDARYRELELTFEHVSKEN